MTKLLRTYRITGLVQGVGFRPTLWHTARSLGLAGTVNNDASGVTAVVEGEEAVLALFPDTLRRDIARDAPLARIDSIDLVDESPAQGLTDFRITESREGAAHTMVTPDAATCRACAADMFDPKNRRWRYAFTNCTHCGPRFTITRRIPYDRRQTSMAHFVMCPACQREYEDPSDRRFHAQPNACPVCGPQLKLLDREGKAVVCDDPIAATLKALREGKIVAIKGLGGFHLACDACSKEAVALLRERKTRRDKPFALMTANLATARQWAQVREVEAHELQLPSHPIVLMKKTASVDAAMPLVAPGLSEIGIMLAYTPVHLLLFHEAAGRPQGLEWLDHDVVPLTLVMTSANPRGEPLVTDNDQAVAKLGAIADLFLVHNRDIVCRCDDSVVRVIVDTPRIVRRARGFTPLAVKTHFDATGIVALGASLKVTAAVGRGNEVFVTEHVGDTENPAVCAALKESVAHFLDILEVKPRAIACDLHPDFFTTRLAHEMSEELQLPLITVQHHHAHAAAVAAEYGIDGPYAGLTLDGVGLGLENDIWGCELLSCSGAAMQRLGHLAPMALPGGDKAAREPWRMGASLLSFIGRDDLIGRFWPRYAKLPMAALIHNAHLTRTTSSAGRLFDGVAALLGLCETVQDEAYAAMLLESTAERFSGPYPLLEGGWTVAEDGVLRVDGLIAAIVDRMAASREAAPDVLEAARNESAALFHGTLSAALADWVARLVPAGTPVCMAGGTFLNRYLASDLPRRLEKMGFSVHLPKQLPPGDGAVSFGQCAVAARRLASGSESGTTSF